MTNQLLLEVSRKSAFEKLDLVNEILDGIGDLQISNEYKVELNRRATELSDGKVVGRPWSKVRLKRRL